MKVEQLEYLLAIANTGSISAVAKQRFVSQTTLSAMVHTVEQELGKEIFRRTAKGVVTTPYGEKVLPVMQRMVDDYYVLKKMDDQEETHIQNVHICAYPCACNFWSLTISGALRERGINAILTVHEAVEEKVMARILDGTSSIGLGFAPVKAIGEFQDAAQKNGLVFIPIFEDGPYLQVSRSSPLASRESISVGELCDEHLATTNCCLSKFYSSKLSKYITHISVFSNIETVKNSVCQHNMISIMPAIAMYSVDGEERMTKVRVTGNEDNRFINYLVYPSSGLHGSAEQAVLDIILDWCQKNEPSLK